MLSQDLDTLSAILSLVGKEISAKNLAKRPQFELDEAEVWAVRYHAAKEGYRTNTVPMPDWLRLVPSDRNTNKRTSSKKTFRLTREDFYPHRGFAGDD